MTGNGYLWVREKCQELVNGSKAVGCKRADMLGMIYMVDDTASYQDIVSDFVDGISTYATLIDLRNLATALAQCQAKIEEKVTKLEEEYRQRQNAKADAWRYYRQGKQSLAQAICEEYGLVLEEIIAFYQTAGAGQTGKPKRTNNGNTDNSNSSYKFELLYDNQVYPCKVKYHCFEKAFRIARVEKPAEGIAAWQAANGIIEGKPFVIAGKQFMFRKAGA